MIANQKELYSLIDSLLKPQGYIKKKDTWYLHANECICFLTLGKSPYSGRYEDLMGCFFKEIMPEKDDFPKYYKNHLKQGIDGIVGKKTSREIFDLENRKFIKDEREITITDLINNTVVPFLKLISTKEGIKKAIKKYEDLIYSVTLDLREVLGVAEPNTETIE